MIIFLGFLLVAVGGLYAGNKYGQREVAKAEAYAERMRVQVLAFRSSIISHISVLETKASGVEHVAVADVRQAINFLRSKL